MTSETMEAIPLVAAHTASEEVKHVCGSKSTNIFIITRQYSLNKVQVEERKPALGKDNEESLFFFFSLPRCDWMILAAFREQ